MILFKRMLMLIWILVIKIRNDPKKRLSTSQLLRLTKWLILTLMQIAEGCQFYPPGEFMKFVRIPEDFPVDGLVMNIEVHDRHNLTLQSLDKNDDAKYFSLVELNPSFVEIRLARTLENLVDHPEHPQSILKFQIVCYSDESSDNANKREESLLPLIDPLPNKLVIQLYIEDVNNHAPQFVGVPYNVSIEEDTIPGQRIFSNINAIDGDKPNNPNSDVYFSITGGNQADKFGLENGKSAAIILKRPLDYESGDTEFHLVIAAMDRGQPMPLSATTEIHIKVMNSDDLHPIFSSSVYRTQIKEFYPLTNASIRRAIAFPFPISAYDQDLSLNVTLEYDIISGNEKKYFELDSKNGTLFLTKEIDREQITSNSFEMQIRAKQTDDFSKFGLAKVIIDVLDLNDNQPKFEVDIYNISIMENLPKGFSVVQVYAVDADINENAEFTYKLEGSSPFLINSKTGWLTVKDSSQLDREKADSFSLRVFAEEKVPNIASPNVKSHCAISIMLLDSNDNSPTFQPSNLYSFFIAQNSEIGSVVGHLTATDPDLGGNGEISYEIQKSNSSGEIPFQVDEKSGYIFLLERPLPKSQYTILIQASDNPNNLAEKRISLAVVQIDLVNADSSHAPAFINSPYQFWVGNEVGVGTSVGQVKVKNFDPKYTVYDLLHSYYEGVPFAIEERTGIIAVVDELMKYSRNLFEFEAYVTDSRNTLTTNVSIHVVDPIEAVTENSHEPIELNVVENSAGAVIANLNSVLIASTRGNRVTEFVLANDRENFAVSSDGTLYTLKHLDRESKSRHALTVISQTRGAGQGIHQILINVEDENDNAPQFDRDEYEGHVRENANPGFPVTLKHPIKVIDLDEGSNAEFKIELHGTGAERFRVDPLNGKIYVGNLHLDREERSLYLLELRVKDTKNLTSVAKLKITVTDINDNAPAFFSKIFIDPPALDESTGVRELLKSGSSQPVSVEITTTEPIVVPETIEIGKYIARVLASDRDVGDNSRVFYRIVSENESTGERLPTYLSDKQYLFSRNKNKHFQIDKDSGKISVAKTLSPNTNYALNISASDRGGLRSYTGIVIFSAAVNDHSPIWDEFFYKFEVTEGTYAQGEIGRISATDNDSGINGKISYRIEWKDIENQQKDLPFYVDEMTGVFYVQGIVDRESQSSYQLKGIASDCRALCKETRTSTVDIEVKVLDKNEAPPVFYNYLSTVKINDKVLPVYRANVDDSVPVGSQVTQVFANDTDDNSLGNGIVVFHLLNHNKVFHIDSKQGIIYTSMKLDYEKQDHYNTSVIAQDLGRPALSSTAIVLINVLEPKVLKTEQVVRLFDQKLFTLRIPEQFSLPLFLTRFNTTEQYKSIKTEFDLIGKENVVSKFRVETNGSLYVTKKLDPKGTYEFIVKGYNSRYTKKFDTRQRFNSSQLLLEPNEMMIQILFDSPKKTATVPSIKKPIRISTKTKLSNSTTNVTKRPNIEQNSSTTRKSNTSSELDKKIKSHHKGSNFYAGEIAILVLSSLILLGGLTAAVSVACVKRSSHRRPRQIPRAPLPIDVHMQKQLPNRVLSNRPLIFPMALPGQDGVMSEHYSETTSDTYTDAGEIFRDSHSQSDTHILQANGYSICPDCRKLRKPIANLGLMKDNSRGRSYIDRGPLKQVRNFGPRDISIQSSHDSGIDGSDQCNCCHSHNFSSDNGRLFVEHYDDSLMPTVFETIKPQKKHFSSQKKTKKKSGSGYNNSGPLNSHFNNRLPDRVVIL